jgi:hypothetical protein
MKNPIKKLIILTCLTLAALLSFTSVNARTFFVGGTPGGYISPYPYNPYYSPYYYPPVYAAPPVVVQNPVLIIPRVGSNDSHYQFDNIYGPGASAAGRLSHSVSNPPPFLYISR